MRFSRHCFGFQSRRFSLLVGYNIQPSSSSTNQNAALIIDRLLDFTEIKYSRNGECFAQSCVNRPESVHGTLRFLFLSHLLYGICVKILIMNRYISKSYTTTTNNIDRQLTERGQLQGQPITSLILVASFPVDRDSKTKTAAFSNYLYSCHVEVSTLLPIGKQYIRWLLTFFKKV